MFSENWKQVWWPIILLCYLKFNTVIFSLKSHASLTVVLHQHQVGICSFHNLKKNRLLAQDNRIELLKLTEKAVSVVIIPNGPMEIIKDLCERIIIKHNNFLSCKFKLYQLSPQRTSAVFRLCRKRKRFLWWRILLKMYKLSLEVASGDNLCIQTWTLISFASHPKAKTCMTKTIK